MKNLLTLLAVAMMTTSCIDLRGDFTAHENLKLIHTTIFGNEKTKTVPAGAYKAKVTFSSSEKVKLSFKGAKEVEVKVKLPSSTSFPRDNGRIELLASQSGQRYDMLGFIKTDYSRSRTYRDRETCTYTTYEQRCTTSCDSRGNCRRTCDRVPVSRRGFQHVEYHYEYTDRFLKLEMVKPNTDAIVATYRGDDRDTRKVYLRQGRCF